MTNFEQLTEEEKLTKCLGYALMHCQNGAINYHHEALIAYVDELKAVIDWISPKLGLEGMRLY